MRLKVSELGKIRHADVEINGITLIAGPNNTGKSTIGKAFFGLFNAFYHADEHILEARRDSIEVLLQRLGLRFYRQLRHIREMSEYLVCHSDSFIGDADGIASYIEDELFDSGESREPADRTERSDLLQVANEIEIRLSIPDSTIQKEVLEKSLLTEFNGQVNNLITGKTAELELCIRDDSIVAIIDDDQLAEYRGDVNLNTEVIYLDDPIALDSAQSVLPRQGDYHSLDKIRAGLRGTAFSSSEIDAVIAKDKLAVIDEIIDEACPGDFVPQGPRGFAYRIPQAKESLDFHNMSSGLKSFAILKTLLKSGVIEQNGSLVLDEPEIHLHPEWQLLYAQAIVLIAKAFDLHILMTSHSPYFIEAIEAYTKKYGIADRARYYQARPVDGAFAVIENVTENLEAIYEALSFPFDELERIENENEAE